MLTVMKTRGLGQKEFLKESPWLTASRKKFHQPRAAHQTPRRAAVSWFARSLTDCRRERLLSAGPPGAGGCFQSSQAGEGVWPVVATGSLRQVS